MADPGKRVIVDGVEFARVWQFPRILGALTAGMQPGRMIIALFMVILLIALGRLWDRFTEPNVAPGGLISGRFEDWPGEHKQALLSAMQEFAETRMPRADQVGTAVLDTRQVISWVRDGYLEKRRAQSSDVAKRGLDNEYSILMERIESTRPRGDFEATVAHLIVSFRGMIAGVLDLDLQEARDGAERLFIHTPRALWMHQTWFTILYGLAVIIVLAAGGGAIARMAAVQQANDQRLSLNEATDFSLSRLRGMISAQILPLVLVGLLALVIMLIGLLMRIPILDIITALCYGLILLLGFLMAFLIVGYLIGFPLLVPAVACENCDGADAMQRAYAYLINRPLHALWYWAVGLFGLAIGFTFVGAIALLTLNLTGALFGELSSGPALTAAGGFLAGSFEHTAPAIATGSWHERWSASIIVAWQALVVCLVAAYVLSYFFSASTIAYLLMRKACDGQETDEVWRPGLIPGTLAPVPPPVGSKES